MALFAGIRFGDFLFTLHAFIVGSLAFFLFALTFGVRISIFGDVIFLAKVRSNPKDCR